MGKPNMKVTAPDGVNYDMEDLLTVSDVMKVFSKTNITIYSWLGKIDSNGAYTKGKFKHAFKIGGQIYIPAEDVKAVIMAKQINLM